MKKVLVTLNLLLALFLVSGCGCSKKQKIIECSSSKENYEVKLLFKADSDNKILYFKKTELLSEVDSDSLEKYQNIMNFMKNWDESIDNYDYNYEINEESISTTLEIDFSKADYESVLAAPGLYSKYYDYEKNIFDLNKAIEVYKSDSDYEDLKCEQK